MRENTDQKTPNMDTFHAIRGWSVTHFSSMFHSTKMSFSEFVEMKHWTKMSKNYNILILMYLQNSWQLFHHSLQEIL